MAQLHFPWLELGILLPLVGGGAVARIRDAERARRFTLVMMGGTLMLMVGAVADFWLLEAPVAAGPWGEMAAGEMGGAVIDGLSAPLLPLAALLYWLMILSTLRAKIKQVPFAWTLVSLSLQLAIFCTQSPLGLIGLLTLRGVPPWLELYSRGRSTRVFTIHIGLGLALLAGGWGLVSSASQGGVWQQVGFGGLLLGVLIRCGVFPFHCWVTDLFEKGTLGTALLFVIPMSGVYVAYRLLLPTAPEWVMSAMGVAAITTALYAAAMATIQSEVRRLLCFLLLSNASLVLVGLQGVDPIGLTASLSVWIAVAMALLGQGLTLRAIESRVGRRSLDEFHGLYSHMPTLAVFFLLTGLSSIGFPGTIGFVATELLVEGAIRVSPLVAVLVVASMALGGIALLRAYFRLFTGPEHTSSMSIVARWPEKIAVLTLTLLVLGGGLFPQPGVGSRYDTAKQLLSDRQATRSADRDIPNPLGMSRAPGSLTE